MNHIKNLLPSESGQQRPKTLEELKQKFPRAFSQVAHLPQQYQLHRLQLAQICWERGDYSETDPVPAPAPVPILATPRMIAEHFGLKTLDTLTTNHMNPEQAKLFSGVIGRVYDWQREVEKEPSRSFILSSRFVGIGKTHIAEAICDSFRLKFLEAGSEASFTNGEPNFRLLKRAKLVTGKELMEAMNSAEYKNEYFLPQHFSAIVLDDIGREGSIKFEKRDEESQEAEKQARYFHLIDHLYKTRRAALFITTNLTLEELPEFFGLASWSRLKELCAFRYMVEIKSELPDMRVVKARGGV